MSYNDNVISGAAEAIYESIKHVPIVSPHGHCDASWFFRNEAFPNPTELLIKPDHYVFRMLYSQGIGLEELGIGPNGAGRDPREVFKIFASNWHLFLGTASRRWLDYSFKHVFAIEGDFKVETSNEFYDEIQKCLLSDEFHPRALFDRFNIEILATTDGANDSLGDHIAIANSDWNGRIIPTFRPDSVIDPKHANFITDVARLGDVTIFTTYLDALRKRREFFKTCGATATDHAVLDLHTQWLDKSHAERLFSQALTGEISDADAALFHGHMLIEMAQMSVEDGLIMQLHVGSVRSTNRSLYEAFGPDMGADIPKAVDWVGGLDGLLNRVGNNPELTVLLFTLDETTYARELAPMAGHWPALKLGPPWWFHDSENGIARYFDNVVESAGYWNLAGFNDDTRAFTSIPARHDLWRRGVAIHLGEQKNRGRMDEDTALHLAHLLTRDFALDTYRMRDKINA